MRSALRLFGGWIDGNHISIVIAIFLFVLCCGQSAGAQHPDITFKNLSVEDGLSHATAHHIMQDKYGFIWISTRDGLNRYDGQNFKVFKHIPGNDNSLSANTIWLTHEDTDGLIWIGTNGGGLNVYDPQQDRFYRFFHDPQIPGGISSNTVTSIFEDQSGTMWIGTEGGGLNKVIRPQSGSNTFELQFKHYLPDSTDSESISNATVMDILQRRDGYLWIATYGGGINRFDIREETFNSDYKIGGQNVMSLAARGDQLWASTKYNGLSLLNLDSNSLKVFRHDPNNKNSLNSDFVWPVLIDSEDQIWAGTFGGGLNRITEENTAGDQNFSFNSYQRNENRSTHLSNNYILSVFEDDNGLMWVATDNGGISMFRQKVHFRKPSIQITNSDLEISDLKFNDFLRDREGRLWMGTFSGLLFKNDDSNQARFLQTGTDSKVINSVEQTHDGTILVGTNIGLYQFNDSDYQFAKPSTSGMAIVDRVYDIVRDSLQNIWLSTNTGVWKLNSKLEVQDRFFNDPEDKESISSTHTGNLFLEADTLWIATSNGGLNKLNIKTKTVKQYTHEVGNPASIGNNKILDILRDRTGQLWVATYGGGLNKLTYQNGKAVFNKYLEEDGLPDNTVKNLAEDSAGKIWITTQSGLARFNPQNEEITRISIPDAYSNLNLNKLIKFRDNQFILTASEGYRLFRPDDFLERNEGAPLRLTSLKVMDEEHSNDQNYSYLDEITLSHEENFLSFEFSLLDYFSSEFANFQYKMEGIDREWIDAGHTNFVNYASLQPDDYIFRVRAKSYDGVLAQNELVINIAILPPFWQTWWFRLAVIGSIAFLLMMIYRYRVNSLLKVERTRQRIASDLHDDISSTLSSITYFARALRVSNPQIAGSKHLELILDSSSEAKEKISDIVWSIDPEHDDWMGLLSKCRRYASDLLESKEMAYQLDISEEIDIKQNPELRKELWLIFKEMVTNAASHSQADEVQITIKYERNTFLMIVEDNGVGIAEDGRLSGNGIPNIKKRAQSVGADISLHTKPGEGTRWEFRLYQ